jgi:hypothetical protein
MSASLVYLLSRQVLYMLTLRVPKPHPSLPWLL